MFCRAALIRRWIAHEKLTPAELKEAGLVDPALINHKQTSEAYQRSLPSYAKTYQRDVRNLKRWIADGRKQTPPDLPPFDAPAQMAEWFRRVKGREPGANLTCFEDPEPGAEKTSPPKASAPAPASGESPSKPLIDGLPPLPAMQLTIGGEVTPDLGLQQVQALVTALYSQMGVALAKGRETEFTSLLNKWQRAVQTLRSWEKDIIKIQEGRGDVLRTRVVNTELVNLFAIMGHSFYNGFVSLLRKYAPEVPEPERRAIARKLRDGCFSHTQRTRYQSAWSEAHAAMILEAEVLDSAAA